MFICSITRHVFPVYLFDVEVPCQKVMLLRCHHPGFDLFAGLSRPLKPMLLAYMFAPLLSAVCPLKHALQPTCQTSLSSTHAFCIR